MDRCDYFPELGISFDEAKKKEKGGKDAVAEETFWKVMET